MRASALVAVLAVAAAWGAMTLPADPAPGAKRAVPRISSDEAIARAVNRLSATDGGFVLRHPRHLAEFGTAGVRFRPRAGGPGWRWRLVDAPADVETGRVRPQRRGSTVVYPRGGVEERYLAHAETIEQQFVLRARPRLGGGDLVLGGRVESRGRFRRASDRWEWRTRGGGVQLGDVTVFDARGRRLPARMQVQRASTRIVVDGEALTRAVYPVTVDPEIGALLRISDMGAHDLTADASEPAVAYNSLRREYLVVWEGDDGVAPLVDNETEIYGQRVDAITGAEVGANDFRISDVGTDGDATTTAGDPAVVFNSSSDEYLVVWEGDDTPGEFEIYGQRLTASGNEILPNDMRLSDMGADGDTLLDAVNPAVAHRPYSDEYLIVWEGDDTVNGETEIHGQRLSAVTGEQVGTNDFRITDMGPNGDVDFDAIEPAVVFNHRSDSYVVAWRGDDDVAPLVDGEFEIFGQRLEGSNAAQIGTNDFRISDMGPNGNTSHSAARPAVGVNRLNGDFLVVWSGDDATNGEAEIFGQRLSGAAGAIGTNDFRISHAGPDGNIAFDANRPAVSYDSATGEYLVAWHADAGVDNDFEIFAQRLVGTTAAEAGGDFRLSDMGGPDGAPLDASAVALPVAAARNEFLAVWLGDDDDRALVDDELEVFGQRVAAGTGAELGTDDARLSDMGRESLAAAVEPATAYNPTRNEYLVVWRGDDGTGGLAHRELEVFGQRVDATTGAELGANDFRISDVGPDGDEAFDALSPAVAYNSVDNEYLVVWPGDDAVNGEFEIFGQRLTATGGEIAPNDIRISDMGQDGVVSRDANHPAVAHNAVNNEYLVVWHGDDGTDNELEIHGQRLSAATGNGVGANDFRISDVGPDGDAAREAEYPDVVHNPARNEYLVVWEADDDAAGLADGDVEVFAQRLAAATGAEVGPQDVVLSDDGPDRPRSPDTPHSAAVAYNPTDDEYLVVWLRPDPADGVRRIYGQRLLATGDPTGTDDARLSDVDAAGPINRTLTPETEANVVPGLDVVHDPAAHEYLVVWQSDFLAGLITRGQRLDAATGDEIGVNDFRISPESATSAAASVVAQNTTSGEQLVVWDGSDRTPPFGDARLEIFARRLVPDVGLFTFAPAQVDTTAGEQVSFDLGWIHPVVWRRLDTIDLRIVEEGAGAERVFWVRWEETPNTFRLVRDGRLGPPRRPGDGGGLETEWARLSLSGTRVVGSGPEGDSVALTLPIAFKWRAAGATYRIEVAATDDAGHEQAFERAGAVTVGGR